MAHVLRRDMEWRNDGLILIVQLQKLLIASVKCVKYDEAVQRWQC